MREINVAKITEAVKKAAIAADYEATEDLLEAFRRSEEEEESPAGKEILCQLMENAKIAKVERIPLCQDCGLAVIFAELGQDVHLVGGSFEDAINEGVRQGYAEGFLRKSTCHPLTRANVVTTPGAGFGSCGEGFLRLTAFGETESTITAAEKIAETLR